MCWVLVLEKGPKKNGPMLKKKGPMLKEKGPMLKDKSLFPQIQQTFFPFLSV